MNQIKHIPEKLSKVWKVPNILFSASHSCYQNLTKRLRSHGQLWTCLLQIQAESCEPSHKKCTSTFRTLQKFLGTFKAEMWRKKATWYLLKCAQSHPQLLIPALRKPKANLNIKLWVERKWTCKGLRDMQILSSYHLANYPGLIKCLLYFSHLKSKMQKC